MVPCNHYSGTSYSVNNFPSTNNTITTQKFLHQQQQQIILQQQQESQLKQELLELQHAQQQQQHQQLLMLQQHETSNPSWNTREDSPTSSASSGCSIAMRKLRPLALPSSVKQQNVDQMFYPQQSLAESQMLYLQQQMSTLSSLPETSNELTLPNEVERNRSRSIVSIGTRLKISDDILDNEKLNKSQNTSASLTNIPINSRRNSSAEALMTLQNRENNRVQQNNSISGSSGTTPENLQNSLYTTVDQRLQQNQSTAISQKRQGSGTDLERYDTAAQLINI